jgi:hypothetical protein
VQTRARPIATALVLLTQVGTETGLTIPTCSRLRILTNTEQISRIICIKHSYTSS